MTRHQPTGPPDPGHDQFPFDEKIAEIEEALAKVKRFRQWLPVLIETDVGRDFILQAFDDPDRN